jgi:hypothetical protein
MNRFDPEFAAHVREQSRAMTQRARIFRLLSSHKGEWVPLYEILPLAAQYSARIHELRKLGANIENRTTRMRNGDVRSWFRLVVPPPDPIASTTQPQRSAVSRPSEQPELALTLFGNLAKQPKVEYPD